MSKKQSKIVTYTQKDFHKAPRLDKIRHYMMQPDVFFLDNEDQEYYERLHQAFLLTYDELRPGSAIKIIQETIPYAESWQAANRLLRDMWEVYSPIMETNKAFRRKVMLEKLYTMAQVAASKAISVEKNEDGEEYTIANSEWMEMARRLYADAAKLEGLDKAEEAQFDPDQIQLPQIIITNNPEAYLNSVSEKEDDDEN